MNLKVERYTAEKKDEWNSFVHHSIQNSFLFQRQFMDYHQDRFQDHSLLIYFDHDLVGAFPANQVELQIQSHGGLSYGGFILNPSIKQHEVLCIFYHVLKYYHQAGYTSILYKVYPSFLTKMPAEADLYALFLLDAKLIRRDPACVVDLSLPTNYQQRRSRSISKAGKMGAWVKQSMAADYFWNEILSPTLMERHQLKPVHTLEEITLLMNRFPDNIKLFECGIGEQPTAGALLFEKDTSTHAQYIATSPQGRKEGTLDYLFDNLLTRTKRDKKYFSFGISSEQQGRILNTGLQDWKEGFGSRTFVLDYYLISTNNFSTLSSYA